MAAKVKPCNIGTSFMVSEGNKIDEIYPVAHVAGNPLADDIVEPETHPFLA